MKDNILVRLDGVSKSFDDKVIIKNISLDIYEGEFLTLLGPSGCGKTTILRMISGLEQVSSGRVFIDGEDVTDIDPTNRKVNWESKEEVKERIEKVINKYKQSNKCVIFVFHQTAMQSIIGNGKIEPIQIVEYQI